MTGGHGHVKPRADGAVARCGGPAICKECALELAQQGSAKMVNKFAWLLERTPFGVGPPIYYGVSGEHRRFVESAWQAIHFSNKRSAEAQALVLGGDWKAVEHGFDVHEGKELQ